MSAIMQTASAMVSIMRDIVYNANNESDLDAYIKMCSNNIKLLKRSSCNVINVSDKTALISAIGRMSSYKVKLQILKNTSDRSSERIRYADIASCFEGRIRTGCITNILHVDPISFLDDCRDMFIRQINYVLRNNGFLKVWASLSGDFIKGRSAKTTSEFKVSRSITTKSCVIDRGHNLSQWYDDHIKAVILKELEESQEIDSTGWVLLSILNSMIHINKFTPQIGSTYIDLPDYIKNKRACINVKNKDNACFAWAVVSALYPVKHGRNAGRLSSYPHYRYLLNVNGIQFPMKLEDIKQFEELNNVSINVYTLKKKLDTYDCEPCLLTRIKKPRHVNLLLVQEYYDDDNEEEQTSISTPNTKFHYVWLKNLSAMISHKTKHKGKVFVCDRCLHYFYNETKLQMHEEDCSKTNAYKVDFSQENIKFKNYKYQEKLPFVIYANFECILKNILNVTSKKCYNYKKYIAHSAGLYLHCNFNKDLCEYKSFRGENCLNWFVDTLIIVAHQIEEIYKNPKNMRALTSEELKQFHISEKCSICGKHFKHGEAKAKDHCHFTGDYRGAAHVSCNLKFQRVPWVPVVFHNLSEHDTHLLIADVARKMPGSTKVLLHNTETFTSIKKYTGTELVKLQFIDSFNFINASLDELAKNLNVLKILPTQFYKLTNQQFSLIKRKGAFPHEYVNTQEKFLEKQLPSHDKFFNNSTMSNITVDEHNHAQTVWNVFNITSLGEYSDLYVKTNVLLLAEVFEQFRDACLKYYSLDPACYVSAPELSWDAMLKHTDITLETIPDVDMLMFFEKGIRGGLTQCTKRYSKANNKYIEQYNPNEAIKYLMHYNIDSMYAWAMQQHLPYGGLKWVENIDNFDYNISDECHVGYILEVDLDYPETIHDQHADLPMAPTKLAPHNCKEEKLLATLYNKKKYVIHYRNLKQCLRHGLVLKKIHRVLQFNQSCWLKPFIELNAELCRNLGNDFGKDLFTLMNNAVLAKTMENVRLSRDIKLITKWEGRYGAQAYISKPNFNRSTIFGSDFVGIELLRTAALFDKPIYIGMSILDISKTILYNFHYEYVQRKYDRRCALCYTDGDSLVYEIRTKDIYQDMKDDIQYFDKSEYAANKIYDIPVRDKKVLGLIKDENKGQIIDGFVGLRARMYLCSVVGKLPRKQVKSVKKSNVNNKLTFDDYLTCIMKNEEYVCLQDNISSLKNHNTNSNYAAKVALNSYDNKRYISSDNINTLPWGHYSIIETEEEDLN